LVVFTDQNELAADKSGEAIPFASPEDIIKNLPKVMSKMFGTGGGMRGNSPTFKITIKEYEEMALNVGDSLVIEINKVK
jgi:hypothetical protein